MPTRPLPTKSSTAAPDGLSEASAASIPVTGLPALGGLRRTDGVRVAQDGDRVWVYWPAGAEEIIRQVLPVDGVELFTFRAGLWYRVGRSIPVPAGDPSGPGGTTRTGRPTKPLDAVILPALSAVPAPASPPVVACRLRLVRDDHPREATGLCCAVAALARWADGATTVHVEGLEGALFDGQILVRGPRLPVVAGAERFWGERVLIPLGRRPDPELPEPILREAAGVAVNELLVLRDGATGATAEAVPLPAFARLTRAALKLAARGS